MKTFKHYTIAGAIFVIITGTISHFIYDLSGKQFLLGFFFPVSESTWEHMKLCFFPMLIYSCFMNKRWKDAYPCVTSALLSGILLGTFLIPVIFYTYSGIIGRTYVFLDIATFVISVLLAFLFVYRRTVSCDSISQSCLPGLLVFAMAICFLLFTYLPPNLGIFIDPAS